MRYLKKRIDTKMDKELSSKQPPFGELVADVARTMALRTPYCLLPTPYSLLPTPYCLLPTPYCLLPTVYCPLPYCLLLATYQARTMASCGSPARTYSMMDEYTDAQEQDGCYVNPFVGEGLYARYLRNWLSIVPKRQMMLLNFDEWTRDAQPTMQAAAKELYYTILTTLTCLLSIHILTTPSRPSRSS